jgi:hypothetical protein
MAGIVQGSILIENSITNPNSNPKYWIDNGEPLSFFDFLKHSKHTASPIEFNDRYNEYLHSWYSLKGEAAASATAKVRDRYVDLLKDISLNFTTAEEKRFLSNIDFNNPEDLNIAIPFYSSKIAEICQFYTKKRQQVQYKIQNNKIKGTIKGIEKNIFDIIIDYIFIDDSDETYKTTNTALSSIIKNLNIEVEELFDTYSDYFNIDSDLTPEDYEDGGALRNSYFTANLIESTSKVGDLFVNFDTTLRRDIFSRPIVLSGFGNLFSLSIEPSFLDLVSNDNIQNIIEDDLPEANLKLSLKKKLLEKYIGTDIYYLSTNSTSTEYVSGVLFKADNPSKNLINSRFATIAAVPSNSNKSAREIGLFFTPDKLGVLHFKTGKNKYKIRQDGLLPDKIYVFPNPDIYGNISNITSTVYDYPLYYIIDNSNQVKSSSFGFAVNDVYNTSYDQLLYAYSSNQERYNAYTKSISSLEGFNFIVNKGIITDWFQDIYGNQFGVVKSTVRKNISYTEPEPAAVINNPDYIVFDGYLFKDGIEGYNFNYSVNTGLTFNNSLRTGVTARTIDEIGGGTFNTGYPFASGEMFALSSSPVRSLYFREFDPYIEAIYPTSFAKAVVNGELCDCIGFMYGDNTFLEDPVLADSESFSESISNYYNTLLECGLDAELTLKAVASGDGTFLIDFPLSAGVAETNDGGSFLTEIVIQQDYPFINNDLRYYSANNSYSSTIVDTTTSEGVELSLEALTNLDGTAFVYNVVTNAVLPLSSAMSETFSGLPSAVKAEVYSSVQWLNVNYDSIFVQTNNYYIIEKIVYEDNQFISSSKPNVYFPSNSKFELFSKPFFIDNNTAYFCKTTILSTTSASNAKAILPEIYEYSIQDHTAKKIYPKNNSSNLTALYTLSGLGVNIVNIKTPDIVYNSRNNIISITMVGEDINELGYLINFKYRKVAESVDNLSIKTYRLNTNGITHNFYDSTLTTFLTSTSLSGGIIKDTNTGTLYFN